MVTCPLEVILVVHESPFLTSLSTYWYGRSKRCVYNYADIGEQLDVLTAFRSPFAPTDVPRAVKERRRLDNAAGRRNFLERYPYKAVAPYEEFMLGREDLLLHPRRLSL